MAGGPVIFCVWARCPLLVPAAGQTKGTASPAKPYNASLAHPQLPHTCQGSHPMGVLAEHAAPCWSVSSVFGRAQLHRSCCPPASMSSSWKPAFSRRSLLFKMCCFHRLHLLLRIEPMDKCREGTKPALGRRMVPGLRGVIWLGQVNFLKRSGETTSHLPVQVRNSGFSSVKFQPGSFFFLCFSKC